MVAAREDIIIEAGATFEKTVLVLDGGGSPRDLSGWTGELVIRDSVDDAEVLAEAEVTCGSDGVVTATIGADITVEMDWFAGEYDLTIASGVRVEPVMGGRAVLRRLGSR